MRVILYIFMIAMIVSCHSEKKTNNVKIQLLRVGGNGFRPANDINKGYGASYYLNYNLGSDTVVIYLCWVNPQNGEPRPESIYSFRVDSVLKNLFYETYKFSDTLKNGVFSYLPNRGEGLIYCGGIFIITIDDSKGNHKYFTFIQSEKNPFENLVEGFESKMYADSLKLQSNLNYQINIDSIVGTNLSYPGFDTIFELKKRIKFTPTEIKGF